VVSVVVMGDGYQVSTDRLLLRPWDDDDLDELSAVFAKPEVWWYPDKRGRGVEETRPSWRAGSSSGHHAGGHIGQSFTVFMDV
jgi:hypothetical protein